MDGRVPVCVVLAAAAVACGTWSNADSERVFATGTCVEVERLADAQERAAALLRTDGSWLRAGIAYANAATLNDALGLGEKADTLHREASGVLLLAEDDEARATALNMRGESLHAVGAVDSALFVYRAALELAGSANEPAAAARAMNNVGIAYHDLAFPDSAMVYLDRAAAGYEALADSLGIAVVENNRGRVLQTVGRPLAALPHFERSLSARNAGSDVSGRAVVMGNIGYSHDLAGDPTAALAAYRDAFLLLETTCRPSLSALARLNLARAHRQLGQPDSAFLELDAALAGKRAAGDARGAGWVLDQIGLTWLSVDSAARAATAHEEAARSLLTLGDDHRAGEAFQHLGVALSREGAHRDLPRASGAFDEAARILATVRRQTGADPTRVSFVEQYGDLYDAWVLTELARDDRTAEERAWAALAAAERGRAKALLDLRRSTSPSAAADVRTGSGDPVLPVAGGDALVDEGRAFAGGAARPGVAGVLYFATTADSIVSWLIGGDGGVRADVRPISRDRIRQAVADVRVSLGGPGGCDFFAARNAVDPASALRTLATLLLPESLAAWPAGEELVIVPHGSLHLVPFAALPMADGQPLGARFAVRYAPSLSLLERPVRNEQEVRTGADPAGGHLVVAAPTMPRVSVCGRDFEPTDPVRQRAAGVRIGALLGPATTLTGDDATEARVRGLMPAASVVHFGTHGFAFEGEDATRGSFIALAPGGGSDASASPATDGLLTVDDVLSLPPLRAEVVTLAACETGLGDLADAEGTLGLQRAFLSQGARSVLVSLWSVRDESTAILMEAFYAHWRGGASKAQALRAAQEALRATDPDPAHWAAFQLVGAS